MANFFGTNGADNLTGTESGDLIQGYPSGGDPNADTGDDVLAGHGGDDTLRGGGGDDLLNGGEGNDSMIGGTGDDRYVLNEAGDSIVEAAGEGIDTVLTSRVSYTLLANFEWLTFIPPPSGAVIDHIGTGNETANRIFGWTGNDTFYGLDGNDQLIGYSGSDTLYGGAGHDTLYGDDVDGFRIGADNLYGGDGNDTYQVNSRSDRVFESFDQGIDEVQVSFDLPSYTLGSNVEWLTFVTADDASGIGNALDNRLQGGSGNDTLSGLDGVDVILGGFGDDLIMGGRQNDVLDGESDLFSPGSDTVTYVYSSDSWVINLATRSASNDLGTDRDIIRGFENAIGGAGHDTISGTNGANTLDGRGGSDELYGLSGHDTLYGGALGDTLDGGAGPDMMIGAAGSDLYLVDDPGDRTIELEFPGEGVDLVRTTLNVYALEANVDNLAYSGFQSIVGTGNELANIMIGGAGDDTLRGAGGGDTLLGGLGADRLAGNAGADTFTFRSLDDSGLTDTTRDRVQGFTDGDKIDVSAIDANPGEPGNQAFVLDTGGEFTAGEIRQRPSGSDLLIRFNVDTDIAAEMTLLIVGAAAPLLETEFAL